MVEEDPGGEPASAPISNDHTVAAEPSSSTIVSKSSDRQGVPRSRMFREKTS